VSAPEPPEAMVARIRDSLERQGMMATLGVELVAIADGTDRPFAAMQATMTALYDRPGISG
jgi:hypothetical protein